MPQCLALLLIPLLILAIAGTHLHEKQKVEKVPKPIKLELELQPSVSDFLGERVSLNVPEVVTNYVSYDEDLPYGAVELPQVF